MWVEKHGPGYRIRDRVGGKAVTLASGYATKTAAKAAATTMKADELRGDALVPRGGELTLAQWIDMWWPSYSVTLRPSSRISAEGILKRYVHPSLGHVELGELVPIVIQRWVADLLSGNGRPRPLSPKTIRNCHGLLHKILSEAVHQRLIRTNPCERTGLPGQRHHEMRFLTGPESERLLAHIPDRWRPLVTLLLATGLRWGEAIGLRVRDVDVLEGKLRVRTTTQELADTAEIVDGEPKTAQSRRTVTFPRDVAELLIPLVVDRGSDDRVFTAVMGGPVRQRHFYRLWMKARKEAGLEGLRVHDLRHTHAAWLISAGVLLTLVQRRLGHKSIAVTSDRYGHLMPEVDEKIHQAVTGTMFKVSIGGTVGAVAPQQSTATHHSARVSAGQNE